MGWLECQPLRFQPSSRVINSRMCREFILNNHVLIVYALVRKRKRPTYVSRRFTTHDAPPRGVPVNGRLRQHGMPGGMLL